MSHLSTVSHETYRTDTTYRTDPADPADPADSAEPAASPVAVCAEDHLENQLPPKTPFKRTVPARDAGAPLLSPRQMRQLQLHHEGFAAALATRLSLFLRAEVTLALAGIQGLPYQRMTESWPDPAHLTLFKTEPLRGVSILQIPTPLGLCIVDLLMGGSGRSGPAGQEMGAIENALLEQVAQMVAAQWCAQAAPLQELKPVLLGYESSARFLQTAPPQSAMLVVALDATLGDCRDQIQIGFPFAALEPLLRRLAAQMETAPAPEPEPSAPCAWNPCFDDVRIAVTGAWHGWEVAAREVLHLKVGDVLRMDPEAARQVEVRLGGHAKFQGRPGLVAGNWAVELTEFVKH
jgi:flagellar motor switch protein FliM